MLLTALDKKAACFFTPAISATPPRRPKLPQLHFLLPWKDTPGKSHGGAGKGWGNAILSPHLLVSVYL